MSQRDAGRGCVSHPHGHVTAYGPLAPPPPQTSESPPGRFCLAGAGPAPPLLVSTAAGPQGGGGQEGWGNVVSAVPRVCFFFRSGVSGSSFVMSYRRRNC